MAREFKIPHNYKDNGRIWSMFSKKALARCLIWVVPVTAIIFNLPIGLLYKVYAFTVIAMPPCLIFLGEFDEIIIDVVMFSKKIRIYYDEEGGDDTGYVYETAKREKRKNRKKAD